MKKIMVSVAVALVAISSFAQIKGQEMEPYRRSSLNMIMLEDPRMDPSIIGMVRESFIANPIPFKYNDHTVDPALKVVSIDDVVITPEDYEESRAILTPKKKKKGDTEGKTKLAGGLTQLAGGLLGIEMGPSDPKYSVDNIHIDTTKRWLPHVAYKYLKANNMAKLMVDKWFGVETGNINVDLIRERAFFNATEMEKMAAEEEGDRSAIDAIMDNGGHEIVGNSFVTVSRFRYMTGDQIAAEIVSGAAVGAQFMPRDLADATMSTAELAALAATVSVGKGYAVYTDTYLFRLVWDDEIFAKINAASADLSVYNSLDCFKLEYIGVESAYANITAGKRSTEEAVQYAMTRSMDKVLAKLEKEYEVFRTKTPLLTVDPVMTANIGTKECVEKGDKYEVLEKVMKVDKKTGKTEVDYKKIGTITVDTVGNNMGEDNDDENASADLFTTFKGKAPKNAVPGTLIRFTK